MTDQQKYVQQVLQKYLELPDTPTRFNISDKKLAERLYNQGIRFQYVETALLLASARRLFSSRNHGKLGPVHSLHYFVPAIMEVTEECLPEGYLEYLRRKVSPYLKSSKIFRSLIGS